MKKALFILFMALLGAKVTLHAQGDSLVVKKIFDEVMLRSAGYENLRFLCKKIGPRLSGSVNAEKAVQATAQMLKDAGADTVYFVPCYVPKWERGPKEKVIATVNGKAKALNACALGMSVGTPAGGLKARLIEVPDFETLEKMPAEQVKGSIVFFNYKMRPDLVFGGYGDAVKYRGGAPIAAAKKGAIATIIRSVTHSQDDYPHTGTTRYDDNVTKIPAFAVSTNDADWLHQQSQQKKPVQLFVQSGCKLYPDVLSYNVVGEIRGYDKPEEIVLAAGHLDSWDLAEGAHDDGTGCVQAIEVIRAIKQLGLKPKRTIRAVMYMNEENGAKGADAYADSAISKKENTVYAIESDAGGFGVQTIGVSGKPNQFAAAKKWEYLFKPYGIHAITPDGGGVDIAPLRKTGTVLSSINPLSHRYFDHHHAANDVFEAVNKRELDLGSFGMTAMVWLVSEYGL